MGTGEKASALFLPSFEERRANPGAVDRVVYPRKIHTVRRAKDIIFPDRPSPGLVTIMEGWAFRYRRMPDGRRRILSILLPGDRVGFEALTARLPHYGVQSLTEVTYSILDPASSMQLLSERRFVDDVLARMMVDQSLSDDWLTYLVSSTAEERVAALLIDLYERLLKLGLAKDGIFTIALTQQQMSEMVGLHAIHLNRVMRHLKERGLIAVTGKEITLLDLDQLGVLRPRFGAEDVVLESELP